MSVKIEILDYKYSVSQLQQMNPDSSFASPSSWTISPAGTWTISGGDATKNLGTTGYVSHPMTFTEGASYRLIFKLKNVLSGNVRLSQHLIGGLSSPPYDANGTYTFDWIQGAFNTDKLSFRASNAFDGSIDYANVYPLSGIDWDNSVVGELDVDNHSDFPVALTFQISDFKDLTSTSGDYSKTFKIPATKNNNNILKNLYTPNIVVDNKVTNQKPCRILFNNLYSLIGLIQIDGVGGYGETPSYYNCVFFGNNISWASKIEDYYMNTIEWGDAGEGLEYNSPSISATWEHEDCDNASNSPIVYPLTSYGDYNETGTASTIQLFDTYGVHSGYGAAYTGYYGLTNTGLGYGTPIPVADWRPAIFIKNTLDKIFNNLAYRINSEFMNTSMFKKLVWLLPNFKYNNPDNRTIGLGYSSGFSGEGFVKKIIDAPTNDQYDNTDYTSQNIILNLNDSTDFLLNGDRANVGWGSDGVFTFTEYGNYIIDVENFGFYWDRLTYSGGSYRCDYVRLYMELQTVGHNTFTQIAVSPSNLPFTVLGSGASDGSDQIENFTINRWFNKGDKVRLGIKIKSQSLSYSGNSVNIYLFGSSSPTSATQSNNANATVNININPEPVEYGQTYNLQDVISPDYKQLDFIKGVAHAFNLQMTTDESLKSITIEPYNEFYKPYSEAIDWTYKLHRNNEISDKWIKNDLKRNIVFKYKTDEHDLTVKKRGEDYFKGILDEFPYREILPDTFEKGDSTFENPFFAGTYNGKDRDTTGTLSLDTAYSGCLWDGVYGDWSTNRPIKGFEFLPRLLYWNKYTSDAPFNQTPKKAILETWTTAYKQIVASNSPLYLSFAYTKFPQATMVDRDKTTSPNLAYGNVPVRQYDDLTNTYGSEVTLKGLYETYYKATVEGLKRNPRIRTVSIDLTTSDIVNLDFRKLIYIDGVYWRINRIIDYNPINNSNTKVELIEWFQLGNFAATAPTFGTSFGTGWNTDGSYDDNNDIGL